MTRHGKSKKAAQERPSVIKAASAPPPDRCIDWSEKGRGRVLSETKTAAPGEVCVWNAVVTTPGGKRLWWGDLSLTYDRAALIKLARERHDTIYIYREHDVPMMTKPVATVDKYGAIEILRRS